MTPDTDTDQEDPKPKAKRMSKDTLVSVRAEKRYLNGMIEGGFPAWRDGEVREVTMASLARFGEDAPGNFTIVTE